MAVGVGGAGNAAAAAQPAAPAAAAPAAEVDPTDSPTVVAGGAASATPVKSGAIGMGTLTGAVGVVNPKDAKSGAEGARGVGMGMGGGFAVLVGCWVVGVGVGGWCCGMIL